MPTETLHIMVVDDDRMSQRMISKRLERLGHGVTTADNGQEALDAMQSGHCDILITDWMMPGVSGPDLVRRIREADGPAYTYVIMVSALETEQDAAAGLGAGADDYLRKPWSGMELEARVRTGERIVRLDRQLRAKNAELQQTIEQLTRAEKTIETLEGFLPVCSICKAVRDDEGDWHPLENYIERETHAQFSHGLCPKCMAERYPEVEAGT